MKNKTDYTKKYFSDISTRSAISAEETIPVIREFIDPSSVLDIGCGIGTWLKAWQKNGVKTILGVDGDYVDTDQLLISKGSFMTADLEKDLQIPGKYDLVMSLEVAEHLNIESAETFISALCSVGNIILFSAAIPHQEGVHHVNEQYPDFWINLFRQHNFSPYDCLREKIWNNDKINICYRQNILFFVNDNFKETYPLITTTNRKVLSVVHPEQYEYKQRELAAYRKILRTPFHANFYFIKKYTKFLLTKVGLWK